MRERIEKILNKEFCQVFYHMEMTELQQFDALYYILFEGVDREPLEILRDLCRDDYPVLDLEETINGAFHKLSVLMVLEDYQLKISNNNMKRLLQAAN